MTIVSLSRQRRINIAEQLSAFSSAIAPASGQMVAPKFLAVDTRRALALSISEQAKL